MTLPDGRVVLFYSYDFQPGHCGTWNDPPESPEVNVQEAWWSAGAGFGDLLTEDELTWLHEDDDAYGALVLACEHIEGEREHARLAKDEGDL